MRTSEKESPSTIEPGGTPWSPRPLPSAAYAERGSTDRWARRSRRLAAGLAWLVVGLAAAVLALGWALGIASVRTVRPGLVHMAPLTAIGLLLGSAALLLRLAGGSRSRAGGVLAGALLLLAVAVLIEYLLRRSLGLDDLLFPLSLQRTEIPLPGRPAPNTALGFALVAASLLTFPWHGPRSRNITPALALLGGLIALQALIGYILGVEPLYRVSAFSPIAVHTSFAILLLSAAVSCALPDRGLVRLITDEGPSGYIVRRLLPVAVLAPFAIEWLEVQGERLGLYGAEVGTSLVIVAALVVMGGAVWASALVLAAADENRRDAEQALRESEARFRTLADNIPQLAWMADASGYIFWYNRRWFEYTGTDLDAMRGWGWQAVHHPDWVEGVTERFRTAIEAGEAWEDTFPLRGTDGTYRWFLSRAQPIRDEAGNVVRWFGTNTDVTGDRQAAEERERLLRQADAANRAKSEFLATMSHELRTPLNAMIGYADLLDLEAPEPLGEQARWYVERIRLAARHQKQLIEDVLNFSRVDAGGEEAVIEEVGVPELLSEISAVIAPLAERKGLRLVIDDEGAPDSLRTDARKLRQILVNLLGNAVKFTRSGHVTLSFRSTDRDIRLAVEDTGIGIDADHLDRLFDAFWQGDRSLTRTSEGSGLGLAISRRFARLLGGDILVDSAPGGGSTFTLVLPRRPEAPDAEGEGEGEAEMLSTPLGP